jgi:hypothetical protein
LDIAEKVKELYEEDEKMEFNLAMRYAMYTYFPEPGTSNTHDLCEDIVKRAIQKVKYTQSQDTRTLQKTKEDNSASRLDAYQKTALNRW